VSDPHTQPILVTGAHRTGTTWVGRLLAANPEVAYVSEPLNVHHRPGVFRAPVDKWYTYICADNESDFLPSFHELLSFRYHGLDEIASLRSTHDLLRMFRDAGIFVNGALGHRRPLLKDPFAVFSLRWFAARLGCATVVTVRHPAAFVSSLKRLNWTFDFADLLGQPLLMRDLLEPYRDRMRSDETADVIGQASLLWTMVYGSLDVLRKSIPSVQVVRHEDLSLDPVPGFQRLYAAVGLQFTASVQREILKSSSSENPQELSRNRVHSVKVDSLANLQNWKRRLAADELVRIRRITGDVADLYYPRESWN
jgi:sulfotransferase family protein